MAKAEGRAAAHPTLPSSRPASRGNRENAIRLRIIRIYAEIFLCDRAAVCKQLGCVFQVSNISPVPPEERFFRKAYRLFVRPTGFLKTPQEEVSIAEIGVAVTDGLIVIDLSRTAMACHNGLAPLSGANWNSRELSGASATTD
jgi:hypothetical protein